MSLSSTFAEELSTVSAPYCLKNIEDVREFLGRHAEKLEKFVAVFCHSFKEQERKGLRHQIVRQTLYVTSFLAFIHISANQSLMTDYSLRDVESYRNHYLKPIIMGIFVSKSTHLEHI